MRKGPMTSQVIVDIINERARQDSKWGGQPSDDKHTPEKWVSLICDYAGWSRVLSGMGNYDKYRKRMVQVAALAVAAVQSLDRHLSNLEDASGLELCVDEGCPQFGSEHICNNLKFVSTVCKLEARVGELEDLIRYAQVSSGVCMCGANMEDHNEAMGHSPVDIWDNARDNILGLGENNG